ncbi:MAG: hypothetical protein PHF20_04570 [Halothiobacillaceae bacterium]|nr:hypothetical protein [Halothiobacillaceae bacterium]
MTQERTTETIDTVRGVDGAYSPKKPKKPRPIDLHSLDSIRLEMQKVYRSMRSGELDVSDGSKLTYTLQKLAELTADCDAQKQAEKSTGSRQQPVVIQLAPLTDPRKINELSDEELMRIIDGD